MIFDRARARPGALGALRLSICGLGVALAAALGGCSTNQNVTNGTPVVTVTSQAAGDFSSYVVGVSLYSMTRSDGYVAYPAGYTYEEFADLTQRVDLSELLNAVGVPSGTYKSVVIGIDFSLPVVYIKGQSTVATVENAAGTVDPGIIYVTVNLDPAHQLVINHNQSTPFALDFDLAASNSVNTTTNVTVIHPFVAATATSIDTGPVRARGLFVAANPSANNFVEDIRPFEDNIYATVGALTVNTTASTYYNINGLVLTGAAGLSAMSKLASNIPVEAYGSLDGSPPGSNPTITPSMTATQVYAGIAVSNGQYEHVRGIVSAISGNSLTVLNATYLYYAGYCQSNLCFTYYPTATVNLSASTPVTEDGVVPPAGTSLSAQSISVGSQIDAVGLGTTSSTGVLTLDATQGLVRLKSTPIWGTLASGTLGSATLNLLSMGTVDLPASGFNFAGTGTSGASDATAASYQLSTGTIDESATPAGTLLRADGFPTSYGSAPPDFTAAAVTAGTSEPADLIIEWNGGTGTTAPFTSYDGTSLALNLANASTAEVVIGPQTTAVTGTPAITISNAAEFAVGNATNGISMFSSPTDFATALGTTLNGSNSVYRVVAVGSYDSASNTLTASRVDVALK
jgi:hypothetical protein